MLSFFGLSSILFSLELVFFQHEDQHWTSLRVQPYERDDDVTDYQCRGVGTRCKVSGSQFSDQESQVGLDC